MPKLEERIEKGLLSLVKDGLLSTAEAVRRLSITEEELEKRLSETLGADTIEQAKIHLRSKFCMDFARI